MIPTSFLHSKAAASRAAFGKFLGAALVSAAAVTVPAHADTINFEGYFGPTTHGDYLQQAGFRAGFYSNVVGAVAGADLVGSFIDGTDPTSCSVANCPVNNPGTYYAALDDSYVDLMSSTAGGQFKIKSFDASFIGGAAGNAYPAISGLVRIQGFLADGGFAVETYQLAGPAANGFNFAHYNTSAAFGNLQFVEAIMFGYACNNAGSCSAFSTDRGQFGVDNINLTAVPEPASFLLFGIGMAGMGAIVRRRRNSL
jgi:hypothetical protein